MIVGINNNETVSFFYAMKFDKNPTLMTQYNNNPAVLIPTNVAPTTDTARLLGVKTNRKLTANQEADFNKRVKQSYKLTGKGDDNFIQYYNDVRFGLAFHRLITLTLANPANRKLPLYLYEFDEDAPYNWGKNRYNIGPQGLGAAHQDELGYLLHITSPSDLKQTSKGNSAASKTLSLMTKLWTDFAKSGRPAAAKQWPAASGTAYTAPYAKISAKSWGHVGRGLRGQRMQVWEDVYNILRRK
ncbi:hypothetical protein ONE63_009609 [Megalurothrips usitatus]|uniref:Carboxylesterase type B domain-containing protein n=1 Tax=Megalurothrips usitatus TaxID=439358 RepID=A0AAV7XF84_9NEOP|nr:hypothetical protein ONE63_009609 [Megalurothrips usitatus]